MNPRAITGLGIVSNVATGGADAFLAAMKNGPPKLTVPRAELTDFDPTKYLGDKGLRTLDRLTKLLIVAARLCLHDAGLKKDNQWAQLPSSGLFSGERVGVCCSNAYGSLEAIHELDKVAKLEDARYINPAKFPNTVSNSASGYVSIWEDLRALNVSVSDGNCGALDAVACTDIFLATKRAEAILTGGGEAMSEALYLAFEKLGAFGSQGQLAGADSILGEGAAFMMLEDLAVAKARSAKSLGEIIGYGTAFVAPKEESLLIGASREAIARACRQALADADVEPKDVDLVATSYAGIAQFDDEERAALAEIVPNAAQRAPKEVFGETLGASGAMGMAAALAYLQEPKIRTVLVLTVGYYGNASAVLMRRAA
jgi:3-oxoacyl-(acyl-carrier-protein) synthase